MLAVRLILIGVILLSGSLASANILQVPGYGTIKGGSGKSFYTKRPYLFYNNLFYAKQPTNLTRFLPPVPADPLPEDEVYDAVSIRGGCPQPGGDENCLFLNVFHPQETLNNSQLLPVMFWIHGGGFSTGSNLLYTPFKYMEHDVVLVQVQYRLGPLGFLSLNTDEVPGNAGIFDQIEALRWVQKYIRYFRGDPDCVTVVGESAGSASVSMLTLAPQAKGLFHRGIGQSGSMLAGWALDREPVNHALRIAELAGCPLEPYAELVSCLRNLPSAVISKAYISFEEEDRRNGGLGFGGSSPVIQVAGAQRLLEREPKSLMESGQYTQVPMMFGANKQEGVLPLAYLYMEFLKPLNLLTNATYLTNHMVPDILKGLGISDPSGDLSVTLTKKYLADAELGNWESMLPGLIDLCSVLFMKSACYETITLHSKFNANAYWYSFDFEGRHSLFFYLFFGSWPPIPHGVNHADDLIYLFTYPQILNATEVALSRKMLQVWTTFAKYGNPTPDGIEMLEGIPKFPAYTATDQSFMSIDANWTVKKKYLTTLTVTADTHRNNGLKGKVQHPKNLSVFKIY